MSDASRLRECLIGREIKTVRGSVSTIVDYTDSFVTIEVESSGEQRNIPMDQIIGTQDLWNKLKRPPHPSEIREYNVSEFNPAYTLALLLAMKECLMSAKR